MISQREESPVMYVGSMDVFLNRWFATYDEARAAHATEGGYLFPYQRQYFVAQAEAVRELGLDPDDPDWERIGWDWACPRNDAAWQRLKTKRETAV
jgi:hypothetical protein